MTIVKFLWSLFGQNFSYIGLNVVHDDENGVKCLQILHVRSGNNDISKLGRENICVSHCG